LKSLRLECGIIKQVIPLFYQIFGQPIGLAPRVLVNHAFTGKSNVIGEHGWWKEIVGKKNSLIPIIATLLFLIFMVMVLARTHRI